MQETRNFDTIIIGGGPAGYAAALYCARAGLSTAVLEMLGAGGQMCLTERIDNYPGLNSTDGFTLGDAMQAQAEQYGSVSFLTQVTSIELDPKTKGETKIVHTTDEGDFTAPTVVVATGATARPLGLPNEAFFADKGIHYCAACDGMRFKGKTVAVVGGGNSALEDALLLSRICEKVYLIHRRDAYRADKLYADAVAKTENIIPVLKNTVESVSIEDGFQGVNVKHTESGEAQLLPCAALFVSVGRLPNTQFLKDLVETDEAGYVRADETTCTSCPGIFAVGDIRTKPLRQVVTAAADGAVSSVFVQNYINGLKA